MKKLLLCGMVLGAVGLPIAIHGRGAPRQDASASAATVERVRVVRRDIGSFVKATGIVRPMVGAEVRVGSRVSGVVQRLPVRIGDTVRRGQVLAELDARDLLARRDAAAAALDSARANLAYASAELARRRELAAEALVAPSELDLAQRAFSVARLGVDEAQAALGLTETQLDYARITAPIGGVVASVTTQQGETVSASLAAPTFVTILDLDRLEVWAYVDETDIGRVRVGQPAAFTVDTYGDREFAARVSAVYPQAVVRDNVVNYVAVLLFEPEKGCVLRPEMTTAVKIALDTRHDVLAVPRRAVRRESGTTYVAVPRGAAIERRPVTTGSRDEAFTEVTSGLREGEEVVVGDAPANTEEGGRS